MSAPTTHQFVEQIHNVKTQLDPIYVLATMALLALALVIVKVSKY